MILRYWRGWTTPQHADAYEQVAREQILPRFAHRLTGYQGSYLLRRNAGEEIEFAVMMTFDSIDCVRAFTGEDYDAAYVPPAVSAVLTRFDERTTHYEILLTPHETS
jgi:antibiotic biosynthesis monooxygenase (ABM) superfamily enzyme